MSSLLGQIWMPSGQELFWFSPELVLVGTIVLILAGAMIVGRSATVTATVCMIGLLFAVIATWRVAGAVEEGGKSGLAPASAAGMLIADNLSVFYKYILILFAVCIMGMWWAGGGADERNAPEFFVLLLGSAVGMALMVGTLNLLMIVVAIEMASLPSYAIVGFDKRDRRGAEVSLKYAVFGAVSAAIMLYGVSLLYGLYGSINLVDVAAGVVADLGAGHNVITLGIGLLCFLGGVAFKISAVPFHFWCPDAFEGARIEVTTWLSVVSKGAGLLLLLRVVDCFAQAAGAAGDMSLMAPLAWTIGVMAMLTCTVGNLGAYMQNSVKRLLAYSSIAHAGYMLMVVAIFSVTQPGHASAPVTAVLVYVVIYLIMNLGAFGITAIILWRTGSESLDAFNGLIRRAPWLAVPMLVCLMSLVGLPPFAGFIGKYWLLIALGGAGSSAAGLYWVLIFVAVINTLISLYYYLRIVVRMILVDDGRPAVAPPISGVVMANACAVLLFALLVFAGPVKRTADRYASNLFIRLPHVSRPADDASVVTARPPNDSRPAGDNKPGTDG